MILFVKLKISENFIDILRKTIKIEKKCEPSRTKHVVGKSSYIGLTGSVNGISAILMTHPGLISRGAELGYNVWSCFRSSFPLSVCWWSTFSYITMFFPVIN